MYATLVLLHNKCFWSCRILYVNPSLEGSLRCPFKKDLIWLRTTIVSPICDTGYSQPPINKWLYIPDLTQIERETPAGFGPRSSLSSNVSVVSSVLWNNSRQLQYPGDRMIVMLLGFIAFSVFIDLLGAEWFLSLILSLFLSPANSHRGVTFTTLYLIAWWDNLIPEHRLHHKHWGCSVWKVTNICT